MRDLMRSQRERSTCFVLNKTLISFGIWPLAVVVVALSGCDGTPEGTAEGRNSFRGTVASFEAKSLLELESLTVANESGEVLEFFADGRRFDEFTPAHVREHMVLGGPVEVTYLESGGRLLIVSLQDAFVETPETSGSP